MMVDRLSSRLVTGATNQASTDMNCLTGSDLLERVRYFPRQMITPADLTQAQDYMRAKLRRHNRMLHGWGVVCGCEVQATTQDWTVTISPGYLLGPQGDEILVDDYVTVDLSQQDLNGNTAVCGDDVDTWCSGVRVDRRAGDALFIAVAYAEFPCRPVRVQAAGCGCDNSQCEYSRIRESFVVRALTALPAGYTVTSPTRGPIECPDTGVRLCPDCMNEPWVILARVTLPGKIISAANIDNTTYRRYAVGFGDWWFSCGDRRQDGSPTPTPTPTPTP